MGERAANDAAHSGVVLPDADSAGPKARARRGRGALTIAVAAAVTVVAWLAIGSQPSEAPPNDVLVSPEQPFDQAARTWTPETFDASGGFTAVALGEDAMVAVGTGRRIDSPPFAYRATDGVEWTRVSLPTAPGDAMTSVVWTGDAFVVTGHRPDLDSGVPPSVTPRVWTSPEGLTWSEAATEGLPDEATISRALFDGAMITAIGWEGPGVFEPTEALPEGAQGRVWESTDGRVWTDVTPPGMAASFNDVIQIDGSVIVSGAEDDLPAVWTRIDTQVWGQTAIDVPVGGQTVVSVAGRDGDLLAIVRSAKDVEGLVTIWRSSNGEPWRRIEGGIPPDSSGWIRWIDGTLFAGAGFTRTVFPDGPELWTSASGNTWTGVEITGGVSPWPPTVIAAISAVDDTLTAFGSRGGKPTAWTLRANGDQPSDG